MAEWSTITDVAEVVDSITETTTTTGKTGSVVLSCPWSQRFAVRDDLILTSRIWPYDNPANLLSLRATSCVINPNGVLGTPDPASPQLHVYQKALLTVGYATVQAPDPMSLTPTPYTAFQESIVTDVDYLRLDHTDFSYEAADGSRLKDLLPQEAPVLPLGRLTFDRTYFNWTGPVPSEYLDAVQTSNSDTVTSAMLQRSFSPETLAYQPGSAVQTVSSDGSQSATLTVRFNYQREGWNRFYNGRIEQWVQIRRKTVGQPFDQWPVWKPYRPVPYAGLF